MGCHFVNLQAVPLPLGATRAITGACHLHPGQTFVHASIETYGHLGRPTVWYIRTFRYITSACYLAGARGSFLASARRELSVAFVQSQALGLRRPFLVAVAH
jgi:hypothetical protein